MGLDVEKHKKFPWIEWHEFDHAYHCTECGGEYPLEDWPTLDNGMADFPAAAKKFVSEHEHCSLEHCLKNLFAVDPTAIVSKCPFCELENGVHRTDCVWLVAMRRFIGSRAGREVHL